MEFQPGMRLKLQWSFVAENDDELSLDTDAQVNVLENKGDWLFVQDIQSGATGLVPTSYVVELENATAGFNELSIGQGQNDGVTPMQSEQSVIPAGSSINAFDLIDQETAPPVPTPYVNEDDTAADELARRLNALKARFHEIDEEDSIPVAQQVLDQQASLRSPPPPPQLSPSKQNDAEDAELARKREEEIKRQQEEQLRLAEQKRIEMEERREKERLRLQAESERRAQEKIRQAQEAEQLRKQQQQEEFDRIRRNSAVLGGGGPEVNYVTLAKEKYKAAVVHENAKRFPDAVSEYKRVLDYLQKAFEKNQVAEKAATLADMERLIEKLSAPPFSNGSFDGKTACLAAMATFGYDLLAEAVKLRDIGKSWEGQGDLVAALRHYKGALEFFIAHDKSCKVMGKPPHPSVRAAMDELFAHAETVKKRIG